MTILAQADEGGLNLPDGAGEGIVFGLVLAVFVGLWVLVQRTRKRAEQEFWERKRKEREGRDERLR
jgi:hypothetical protein